MTQHGDGCIKLLSVLGKGFHTHADCGTAGDARNKSCPAVISWIAYNKTQLNWEHEKSISEKLINLMDFTGLKYKSTVKKKELHWLLD